MLDENCRANHGTTDLSRIESDIPLKSANLRSLNSPLITAVPFQSGAGFETTETHKHNIITSK